MKLIGNCQIRRIVNFRVGIKLVLFLPCMVGEIELFDFLWECLDMYYEYGIEFIGEIVFYNIFK